MSNNWFGALPFDWPILINTAELHFYFNAQDKWPNMVLFGLLSRDGNLGYLSFSPVPSRRVWWVRQGEGPRGGRPIRNSILFCWQSPPSRMLPIKLGSHQSCSTFGTVIPVYLCGDTRRDSLRLKTKWSFPPSLKGSKCPKHATLPTFSWKKKHRKNCECCHHHSLFNSIHNVNVNIIVLNCQKWNQCLKCQVSGHKSPGLLFDGVLLISLTLSLSLSLYLSLYLSLSLSFFWSGHGCSSLGSHVSKVTSI